VLPGPVRDPFATLPMPVQELVLARVITPADDVVRHSVRGSGEPWHPATVDRSRVARRIRRLIGDRVATLSREHA
jgi:hypothetical protein